VVTLGLGITFLLALGAIQVAAAAVGSAFQNAQLDAVWSQTPLCALALR
jgi:hypothetical protein